MTETIPDDAAIADLEAEIERLSDAAERCRKTLAAAKVAGAAGALALAAILLGAVPAGPEGLVAAIALGVGGIGLFGSSRGTLQELEASRAALERRRNEFDRCPRPPRRALTAPPIA